MGRKAPKYFTVNTPVLDKQGRLQPAPEDSELEYESIKKRLVSGHATTQRTPMHGRSTCNPIRAACSGPQEVPNGLSLSKLLEQEQ